MSLANQTARNVAPKKLQRAHNANNVQSRWVFAVPKAHDVKTHRPTLSLRWSKNDTL